MIINDENYLLFTAHYYDINQLCGTEEYFEDLKRILNLRKMFKRYSDSGEINIRLALNHIIVLYNCFGSKATDILFFKLHTYESYIAPFILFLDYMPETIRYKDKIIHTASIKYDPTITNILRSIGQQNV